MWPSPPARGVDAPTAPLAPSEADALRVLETGEVPGAPRAGEDDLVAFLRSCLKLDAFKAKVWPHLACFVDASNVARRRRVAAYASNEPKARLADLDSVVAELRRLRYVPIVVSDANLFQLIDEPYEWQRKYTEYPHSVARGREADTIVLRALRKLPEAACVTNDRYSKPNEARDFADVLAVRDCFYRHAWEADAVRLAASDGSPMPGALRRLARWLGTARPTSAPDA